MASHHEFIKAHPPMSGKHYPLTILSHYKSETKPPGHDLKKNRRRTANAIGIKRMPEAITGNHPTYAPKQAMKQAIGVMMPTNFWSAGEKLGAGVCVSGGTPSL